MNELKVHSGGCLCSAVKFSAKGVSDVHVCHCTLCRRWSGGSSLSMGVSSVEFTGEANIGRHNSSAYAQRGFCRNCGSSLFFQMNDSDHCILSMGAFDDSADFVLGSEIYVDEKPLCYGFSGDHPRLTGAEFLASIGVSESEN
jgi:hypothetical protein